MFQLLAAITLALFLLASCATQPLSSSREVAKSQGQNGNKWWRGFGLSELNEDVEAALANSPNLQAIAHRIDLANAMVSKAQADLLPRINMGFGIREGRRKEADFGPYGLAPWRSNGFFAWELDLFGKLGAAKSSAIRNQKASVWDWQAARLFLASRVTSTRLNLHRFNAEIALQQQALENSKEATAHIQQQIAAGLLPESVLSKQQAAEQEVAREKLDLERLRDLTLIQLRTLRGGTLPASPEAKNLPKIHLAKNKLSVEQALKYHPSLNAAKERLASAFLLEKSAKLNLLPSFSLNATLSGGQNSLANRYLTWLAQVGPSLDIPVYDPARLAIANKHQVERQVSSAKYREVALKIIEELDSALTNLNNLRRQLKLGQDEAASYLKVRKQSAEELQAGLISQTEFLKSEQQWLKSHRKLISLRQAFLEAQVSYLRATGGGIFKRPLSFPGWE